MDKQYNVDDILSEIKSRKIREKAGQAAEEPSRESRTDRFMRDFKFDASVLEPPEQEGSEPFRFGRSEAGELGFSPAEPQEERKNPLAFDGHVRSIADRAKIRRQQSAQPREPAAETPFKREPIAEDPFKRGPVAETPFKRGPVTGTPFRREPIAEAPYKEEPVTEMPPEREPTADAPLKKESAGKVDFSSFRSGGGESEHDRTRVLPKFGFSRELDLEDVRKMDFGGVSGEPAYYGEEDDDEEENTFGAAPAAPAVDFSEYNSVQDRKDVATDIARTKMWLFIRCGVTAFLTVALLYMAFAGEYVMWLPEALDPERSTRMYIIVMAAVTVLVALVNSSPMGGGLIGLVKMRSNSDTLASIAMLAAIGQSAVWVYHYELVDVTRPTLYCGVAALIMLFNALGKFSMIHRIQQNFKIIASGRKKKAVMVAQSDSFCREFVRETSRRRPVVAFSAKSDFFTDFLALSYSDKYDVGIHKILAPACLGCALLVCVITYALKGSPVESASAFTAILCMCATFSSTFIENVPLGKLTQKLAPQGGMVSGNKAVEDFCDTAAVILRDTDLFPEGCVRLHGIKASSRGRVDEAILDAASVICSMDSALSPVFLEMIGGDKRLLKKVDNVVYENGMGVSAWVDSRRVLIGNRQLLLNHGIALSPEKYEQKYASVGGESLYLSSGGEVSAQFVMGYHMDGEMAVQLDALAAMGKILIIYTSNPHITQKKLWEMYGYPQELCRVMPAERHQEYRDMARPRENVIAEIAYSGRAHTMIAALVACAKARSSILSATILQMLQIIIGYSLVTFLAFMNAVGTLTVVELGVYQLFWFLVIFLLQQLKAS